MSDASNFEKVFFLSRLHVSYIQFQFRVICSLRINCTSHLCGLKERARARAKREKRWQLNMQYIVYSCSENVRRWRLSDERKTFAAAPLLSAHVRLARWWLQIIIVTSSAEEKKKKKCNVWDKINVSFLICYWYDWCQCNIDSLGVDCDQLTGDLSVH